MTPRLKLGVDIDGVLADFTASHVALLRDLTGRDLFGNDARCASFPTTWNYPQTYGYTAEEDKRVWDAITTSTTFWLELAAFPHTPEFLRSLNDLRLSQGADIYFITSRPGVEAKMQTEQWLAAHGMDWPTVLITSKKADACRLLKLDAYIDDNVPNMEAVLYTCPDTQGYLFHAPYNANTALESLIVDDRQIIRVHTLDQFLKDVR